MKHQVVLFVFSFFLLQPIGGRPNSGEPTYDIEDVVKTAPFATRSANISVIPQPETESINQRKLYTGHQLWKIDINDYTARTLEELRDKEEIYIWGGNHSCVDIVVKPENLEEVKAALNQQHIKYNVLMQDLQKAIEEENPPQPEETDDRKGHRMTWQTYHRMQDIHGYLEYLAQTYPDLCSITTIGYSVQGKALKVLKISNGNANNKAIWIDGGMHAREWITPASVTYIINHLVSNFENEPKYIQNLDWYIAPLMNPDGYEYTHEVDRLWRKNRARSGQCAGTDLNRNFGYRWGGQGVSKNPCRETYGGTGPFSEPETAAIQRFITNAQAKWRTYISFHSYGQYILYPWGYGRVVPPDYKDLENVARKAAAAMVSAGGPQYTVGPSGSTLYPAAGGSDDWAKGVIKMKYTYTIELRDTGRYGFILPANFINPTAKEALAAVKAIAEATAQL